MLHDLVLLDASEAFTRCKHLGLHAFTWSSDVNSTYLPLQGDMLVHLLEQPELHGTPSGLAAHRLQGLLDTALRSSSVAASPHVDVVGEGVLGGVMDKRSILQLVTAATCSLDAAAHQVHHNRSR